MLLLVLGDVLIKLSPACQIPWLNIGGRMHISTTKTTNTQPTESQVVHPGISKADWDSALTRSGINPVDVAEYNAPGHGSFGRQVAHDTPAK